MRCALRSGQLPGRLPDCTAARTARPLAGSTVSSSPCSGVFGAVSLWVLAVDLWQVVVNGRVWTGTDGALHRRPDAVPGLDPQRLAPPARLEPVRAALDAGRLLPARGDDLGRARRRSGSSPTLTLLLWKPVAVWRDLLRRARVRAPQLSEAAGSGWPRSCWRCSSVRSRSSTGSVGVIGDLFPGFLSWGYTFGLLALAAQTVAAGQLRPAAHVRPERAACRA